MARDTTARGLRDEAEVGPAPRAARELRRLSELRYQVAEGEPDVRGWHVFASTGRELGTVSDLLVDTDAGEVVMLDVDLRRGDRHTLAPVRAAWIDHATRRVVLDAREVARADAAADEPATAAAAPDADDALPALPRAGALSDEEVRRFNDDYGRAYGARGVDAERDYRLRRGDEELRFAAGPRRLLEPAPPALGGGPPSALGTTGGAEDPTAPLGRSAEGDDINRRLADPDVGAARRQAAAAPTDPHAGARPPGTPSPQTGSSDLLAAASAADARFAEPAERRGERVDDASAMDASQGIDPRELDARVRIDEGGTVDADAPVAGVRYDTPDAPAHSYGQPADAYGPDYGDGRIGFDHVSRGPYTADDAPAADAADAGGRAVRYRSYGDRYAGPGIR